MTRKASRSACFVLVMALGCSWVALSPEAAGVRVAKPDELSECKRIARTTSSVASKVWFVKRNQKKVGSELETLARNEAAREGGDAVAPISEAEDGRQEFAIYSCGGADATGP